MKKTIVLAFIAGLATTQSLLAYGPMPYGQGDPRFHRMTPMPGGGHGMHAQRLRQQDDPKRQLLEAVGKLRAFMGKSEAADKMKLAAFLETEITPFFDFAYMTQWAAGPRFDKMSANEKAAMEGEIKRQFLSALARGLGGSYANSRLQVTRARPVSNNEVQVGLRVVRRNAPPVKMKFRFYRSESGWKVFDVVAFNSSAIMHFRNAFNKK
jgi:phospholipid transport system substrate-binding protein